MLQIYTLCKKKEQLKHFLINNENLSKNLYKEEKVLVKYHIIPFLEEKNLSDKYFEKIEKIVPSNLTFGKQLFDFVLSLSGPQLSYFIALVFFHLCDGFIVNYNLTHRAEEILRVVSTCLLTDCTVFKNASRFELLRFRYLLEFYQCNGNDSAVLKYIEEIKYPN